MASRYICHHLLKHSTIDMHSFDVGGFVCSFANINNHTIKICYILYKLGLFISLKNVYLIDFRERDKMAGGGEREREREREREKH